MHSDYHKCNNSAGVEANIKLHRDLTIGVIPVIKVDWRNFIEKLWDDKWNNSWATDAHNHWDI